MRVRPPQAGGHSIRRYLVITPVGWRSLSTPLPSYHPRRLVGDDAVYTDGHAEYCVRCRGEFTGATLRQTTAAECLDEVRLLGLARAFLLSYLI